MKSALVETATSVLGNEQREHPDWFRDKMAVLEPLLQKRNNLYIKGLVLAMPWIITCLQRLIGRHSLAVRTAKNKRFVANTEEAQKRRFDGKMWKCIREMQRGCSGLAPMKTAIVADDDGVPCVTASAQEQQWKHHFTKVLNVISSFDAAELEKLNRDHINLNLMTCHLVKI